MTAAAKKKLLGVNAAIWSGATLAAFILPLIAASISSGSGRFLQVLCFALPLVAGMYLSTTVISKSIGDPTNG